MEWLAKLSACGALNTFGKVIREGMEKAIANVEVRVSNVAKAESRWEKKMFIGRANGSSPFVAPSDR